MPPTVIHTGPPTHPALHIRDVKDAHVLLEAVRLNMLPLIRRRLNANERDKVASGNVFVWEEAENDGGLLRWTDGRRWSQSRMRGDYLFYEEKMETTQEERDAKAAIRARRTTDPLAPAPPPSKRKDRPNRPNGLTKQTYSALVYLPGINHPRKWHVVAYFTGNDYLRLPVIESYQYLRNLRAPEGIFVSSKANAARNDRYSINNSGEGYIPADIPAQTDLAHSSQHATSHEVASGPIPLAPSSPSSSSSTAHWHPHSPFVSSATPGPYPHDMPLPRITTLTDPHARTDLPPTSHTSHTIHLNHPSPSNYTPLSAEDRRVLSSFRVVL